MGDNQDRWRNAAPNYAREKGDIRYSCFCRDYMQAYFRDLTGQRVLDAGCGDGEYTQMFDEKGADAFGCDVSDLVIAKARITHPHCHFAVADLTAGLPYDDGQFDLVFCNLVLMDIDPIDRAADEFARVLKSGGRLFVSIVHPAFYPGHWLRDAEGIITHKAINSYLSDQAEPMLWGEQEVYHFHRPLSYYFNVLADAGFLLKKTMEPSVYEPEKIPDIPLYLFGEWIKG